MTHWTFFWHQLLVPVSGASYTSKKLNMFNPVLAIVASKNLVPESITQ